MEDEGRVMRVEDLKYRVACGTYPVDSTAVAEAMLARSAVRRLLLAGRSAPRREDGAGPLLTRPD